MIQTKMMKKQKYEAPALTVVEFKTERGFATSLREFTSVMDQEFEVMMFQSDMESPTELNGGDFSATYLSNGSTSGSEWNTGIYF